MQKIHNIVVLLFFIHCLTYLVAALPKYNMSAIYAGFASDEIFTPDQYAFNVSCLGCFVP
jgi:hypothetical protein